MQTQLYPAEFGADSIERLVAEHSRRSHAIYLAVVAALFAMLALLPLLRVNVTVQSNGIIRPVTEKHEIRTRAAGIVERLLANKGQWVAAGDPILVLRANALDDQSRLLESQVAEARRFVADLELLTRGGTPSTASFQTARYRQAYAQLRNDLRESTLKRERAARALERARALTERGLAPAAELEEKQFQMAQSEAEAAMIRERYGATWQGELVQARAELRERTAQHGKVREDRTLYTVTSPVSGTMEEMQSLSPGSFLTAGERFAVISPTSALVAEVYVASRDIGLIRPGSPVRMQIDAFNYNEWGFATGRVQEISEDFVLVGGQPVFRVRCALDQDHLALRNGFRGRLRKGMTMRARFFVAERTLFQLLYDNVDDWLNPAQPGPAVQPPNDAR